MAWQFSLYLLPLGLAAGISSILAVLAVRKRRERTAPQVVGILAGAAIWYGLRRSRRA